MTVAFDIFKNAKDYETYPPGEMIFEEGEPGDVMYVVIEGEVDIVVRDEVVDQLSPGDIFGEMALIDDSPRSPDGSVEGFGEFFNQRKILCRLEPAAAGDDDRRLSQLVPCTSGCLNLTDFCNGPSSVRRKRETFD